jgi:thiol peroxidase
LKNNKKINYVKYYIKRKCSKYNRNFPSVGSTIKDFALVDSGLNVKTLETFEGKKKVFNIFPSIDTPTCASSARKFNEEASALENTVVINVSKDLPFALGRFCAAEGLNNVETLSDFRSSFGDDYEVTITDSPMKGLLSRAVIVADENNKVVYTEQVSEIADEPDYQAALAALK